MIDFNFYTLRIANPLHLLKFDKLMSDNLLLKTRLEARQGEWFIKPSKGETQQRYNQVVNEISRFLTSHRVKHRVLNDDLKEMKL